jgi:succinate dehydrogenase / fumarate reductase cytochrome b subunit
VDTNNSVSFFGRHEFLIRRLHSLSGLVPVGAYMVVHLVVNASLWDSPASYQRNVYSIHGLGSLLVFVEWAFIFLPILFHGIVGVAIIPTGSANTTTYPYLSNARYALQRATGVIAFAFIFWHVFHMHGWFHFEAWLENVAQRFNGALFRPYNAASSLGQAMSSLLVQVLYGIGMLSCVYHLANGIWTMGMTWGVWTSPTAQRRASWVCAIFGVVLAVIGVQALVAAARVDVAEAKRVEDRMYNAATEAGTILPNEHKRSGS